MDDDEDDDDDNGSDEVLVILSPSFDEWLSSVVNGEEVESSAEEGSFKPVILMGS